MIDQKVILETLKNKFALEITKVYICQAWGPDHLLQGQTRVRVHRKTHLTHSQSLSHTHTGENTDVNVLKSFLELVGTEQKDIRALNRIFLSFVSINVYYKLAS